MSSVKHWSTFVSRVSRLLTLQQKSKCVQSTPVQKCFLKLTGLNNAPQFLFNCTIFQRLLQIRPCSPKTSLWDMLKQDFFYRLDALPAKALNRKITTLDRRQRRRGRGAEIEMLKASRGRGMGRGFHLPSE